MSSGRNHRSRIRLLRRELDEAQADNAALCKLADGLAGWIVRLLGELDAAKAVVGAQEREIEHTTSGTFFVTRLGEQAEQLAALRRERDELRERLGLIEEPPS